MNAMRHGAVAGNAHDRHPENGPVGGQHEPPTPSLDQSGTTRLPAKAPRLRGMQVQVDSSWLLENVVTLWGYLVGAIEYLVVTVRRRARRAWSAVDPSTLPAFPPEPFTYVAATNSGAPLAALSTRRPGGDMDDCTTVTRMPRVCPTTVGALVSVSEGLVPSLESRARGGSPVPHLFRADPRRVE